MHINQLILKVQVDAEARFKEVKVNIIIPEAIKF